jgi:hypothetical protein
MPSAIIRDRILNNIGLAVREAEAARRVKHPGIQGRIRELLVANLLRPVLPNGFDVVGGKIENSAGQQSPEIDAIVYSRSVLPPVMYSECDGVIPVEAAYFAIQVKSTLRAQELKSAVDWAKGVAAVEPQPVDEGTSAPRYRCHTALFAYGSNLTSATTEVERYLKLDTCQSGSPAVGRICVTGKGYWRFDSGHYPKAWVAHSATAEHGEVVDFVADVVDVVLNHPATERRARFGAYLRDGRPTNRLEVASSK